MKISASDIIKILGYVVAILATIWGVKSSIKPSTPQPINITVPPVSSPDTGLRKEVTDLQRLITSVNDSVHNLQSSKPNTDSETLKNVENKVNSIDDKLGELKPIEADLTFLKEEVAKLSSQIASLPRETPKKEAPGIVCNYCKGTGKSADGKACGPCGGDGTMTPNEKAYDDRVKADKAKEFKGDFTTVVPWVYDYGEAVKLAKKLHRPLFLAFATEGCGPCEVRKQQTYPAPQVWAALTTEYIPVFVYTDSTTKTSSERALASKYGITRYPNAIVDRLDGSLPKKFTPPVDPNEFITVLHAQ